MLTIDTFDKQTIVTFDKFNIINSNFKSQEDINYNSIIKNYIENYFESDINIYHPDYLSQLIWNNKVNIYKVDELYNESIDEYLIHIKQNIRQTIKKDNFSISSLNKLIANFNFKISKIQNILHLNVSASEKFIEKLFSDPILISFIESETEYINNETINEIKILCSLIKSLSKQYIWFLKLIGNSLKNNIPNFNCNIPNNYKSLYELFFIIEYIDNIKKSYIFINDEIHILINPISEILKKIFLEIIPNCNINEFLNLITNTLKKIFNIIKDPDYLVQVKNTVTLYFSNNNLVKNLDNLNYNNFCDFLNVLAISKKEKIIDPYLLILFENEKINFIILDIIDNFINENNKFIKNIIPLLSNIKNKDIFIDNYHKNLIKRLLSCRTNLPNEQIIINELENIYGYKNLSKINKVINDIICSNNDNLNYNKHFNNKFNTITTSYSNWDINYSQGYIDFSNCNIDFNKNNLTTLIFNYDKYYSKIYSDKRKLIWLLQYGEVEVVYLNVELTLLPIQLLILELFNDNEKLKFDEIKLNKFLNNYSDTFKNNIINSLINGRILILKNSYLYLTESTNIENNLINIFINENSYIKNMFVNVEYEIAHNREDIIKTIINHYLKKESLDKNNLYNLVKNDIKLFELNNNLFMKSIESLIKLDYIKFENNIYIKLTY
jgi:hypothetical protein